MFRENFRNWPPVTKNLIIINVMIWLVEFLFPSFAENGLYKYCALHFVASDYFNVGQVFTYMFIHDNHSFMHVFFNMFSLYMFGLILERVWGSKRFLFYYIACGLGAALVQETVWWFTWEHDYIQGIAKLNGLTYQSMQQIVDQAFATGNTQFLQGMEMFKNQLLTVGASGAVFGILLAFAFVFPDMPLYLFFIPVPIKAKYMVAGYAVIEFFLGVGRTADSIAHFAHLGGMIFGLIILLYWRSKGKLRI